MESTTEYRPTIRPSARSWQDQHNPQPEADTLSPALFYTSLRQHGARALTVDFCLRDASRHALPTGELEEIYFSPELGIVMFFRFAKVTISGRNLSELYDKLCEGRITMIRDFCEESAAYFDEQTLMVSKISYESENLDRLR
jgi:hypothetical protein